MNQQPNRLRAVLSYSRTPGNPAQVEVELEDIRAADSLLIYYDFDRDGWSINQASRFEWPAEDAECDPDWQEVAFIQAWAREVEEP